MNYFWLPWLSKNGHASFLAKAKGIYGVNPRAKRVHIGKRPSQVPFRSILCKCNIREIVYNRFKNESNELCSDYVGREYTGLDYVGMG